MKKTETNSNEKIYLLEKNINDMKNENNRNVQ